MQEHATYWKGLIDDGIAIVFGLVLDPRGPWGVGITDVANESDRSFPFTEGVENLPEESKKSLKLAVDAWKIRSGLAPCGSLYPIFILLLCIICRSKRRLIVYSFCYKAISHTEDKEAILRSRYFK